MAENSREEYQRQRRRQQERFTRARRAETWYAAQLRKIATQIGALSGIYQPDDPASSNTLIEALKAYSKVIEPWARNTAKRMLADVARRDAMTWTELSREMGKGLREEIDQTPIGDEMRSLLAEQVSLITSLPLEAAQRVHDLTLAGITEGSRGGNIVQMIMQSGEVARSRATLIARTETARTATTLTQARASWIGSEGYIWRNVGDADVRPALGSKHFARMNTLEMGSHRKLEGQFIRWDSPPIAGTRGERAHAGCIYNCRCWPEVVLPTIRSAA